MKRTSISLQVIMAGKYEFEVGKKVNFRLDQSLGSDFSGIVVQTSPETMRMMVKVFTEGGHDVQKEETYDSGRALLGRKAAKKGVWRKLEGSCTVFGDPGTDQLCWA